MDFSAANTALWSPIVQIGIIAGLILLANVLRRKIYFIQTTLMPTAVLAGFILLILMSSNILQMSTAFLESITYHALALGFIAMALRVPEEEAESEPMIGSRSGALIVSTYLVQALVGLIISLGLAYTIMPDLFKASGILLPMAYGQGPGQAYTWGHTYEASWGFENGTSFGLAVSSMGFVCASIGGVVYLRYMRRKGRFHGEVGKDAVDENMTLDQYAGENEIPLSESMD